MIGHDQNFRELSVNVISFLIIFVKHKIHERQFPPLMVILSEKCVNYNMISRQIPKITFFVHKWEFAA